MAVGPDSQSRFLEGRVDCLTPLELTQAIELVRAKFGNDHEREKELEEELKRRPLDLKGTAESVWNR